MPSPGNCASGVIEDVDDLAHECYQSRKYLDDLEDGGWIYKCPCCEREFSELSALYQHAEDVSPCSSIKGNGCLAKLERFIAHSL